MKISGLQGLVSEVRYEEPSSAPLAMRRGRLSVDTPGRSFTDLTPKVREWLEGIGADCGQVTAFIRHTSASLAIQENADPDVQADLLDALDRLAPENAGYRHTMEGPDDMPAHIRALITSVAIAAPVAVGRMLLGNWQALYLLEHRAAPHERQVELVFLGCLK